MAGYDYDIGIIGGGAAGLTVTAGSARLGAKTVLFEKEQALGGDCLHYGCVPSKTLIKTAALYHQMKNADKYGLPEVEPGPVDYQHVAERIRSVIASIQKHDSPERFCKLGARVEFGSPQFMDEHSVRSNGKIYSAKSWVVATGSSPMIPPIEGLDKTPYITNKEIFSLQRLPESMVVLGAGPIAVEMAQAMNRLGSRVTVIQRSGQILSKEDRDMADMVQRVLEKEGVKFYLNSKVQNVRDLGTEREINFSSSGKLFSLKSEALFVALGRTPNVTGLALEDIDIIHDGSGIAVDGRLRTTRKNIYAAGDITGKYQFTHAAGYEGGIVISNAVFRLPRKVNYTLLPWCTYTQPELAGIGMNEKRANSAGIEYSIYMEEFKDNDRSLAEGEETGKIKMILDRKEKPLGVQILGPHAGDLLCEWVAVLNGKVKLSTLAASVHPYPTLGEINKRVAGNFLSGKIFSDKVKKGLKLFFNLKGRACFPEDEREG